MPNSAANSLNIVPANPVMPKTPYAAEQDDPNNPFSVMVEAARQRASQMVTDFYKTGSMMNAVQPAAPAAPAPAVDPDMAPPGSRALTAEELTPPDTASPAAKPVDMNQVFSDVGGGAMTRPVADLAKDFSFDPAHFAVQAGDSLTAADKQKLVDVIKERANNGASWADRGKAVWEGIKKGAAALPGMAKSVAGELAQEQMGTSLTGILHPIDAIKQLATETATRAAGVEASARGYKNMGLDIVLSLADAGRKLGVFPQLTDEGARARLQNFTASIDAENANLHGMGTLSQYVTKNMALVNPNVIVDPERVQAASIVNDPLIVTSVMGPLEVGGLAAKMFGVTTKEGTVVATAATEAAAEAAKKTLTSSVGDWLYNYGLKEAGAKTPTAFAARGNTIKAATAGVGGAAGAALGGPAGAAIGTMVGGVAGSVLSGPIEAAASATARGAGKVLQTLGETLPARAAEETVAAGARGAVKGLNPLHNPFSTAMATQGAADILGGNPEQAGENIVNAMALGSAGELIHSGWNAGMRSAYATGRGIVNMAYDHLASQVDASKPMSYGIEPDPSNRLAGAMRGMDTTTQDYVKSLNQTDPQAAGRFEGLRQAVAKHGIKIMVVGEDQFPAMARELDPKFDGSDTQPGFYSPETKTVLLNGDTAGAGHEVGHALVEMMPEAAKTLFAEGIAKSVGEGGLIARGKKYLEARGQDISKLTPNDFRKVGMEESMAESLSTILKGTHPEGQSPGVMRQGLIWLSSVADDLGLYNPHTGIGGAAKSPLYQWGNSPVADQPARTFINKLFYDARNTPPVQNDLNGVRTFRNRAGVATEPNTLEELERNPNLADLSQPPRIMPPAAGEDWANAATESVPVNPHHAQWLAENAAQIAADRQAAEEFRQQHSVSAAEAQAAVGETEPPWVTRERREAADKAAADAAAAQEQAAADARTARANAVKDARLALQEAKLREATARRESNGKKSMATTGVTPEARRLLADMDATPAGGDPPKFPVGHLRRIAIDNGFPVDDAGWSKRGKDVPAYSEAPAGLIEHLREKQGTQPGLTVSPTSGSIPVPERAEESGLTVSPTSGSTPAPERLPEPPAEPGGMTVAAPKRPTPPEPAGARPEPPALEVKPSTTVPTQPVEGATRALEAAAPEHKATVDTVTRAAQEGRALSLDYNSVKTEQKPGEVIKPERRRELNEAYAKEARGAMSEETRDFVEKTVVPNKWATRKDGQPNAITFDFNKAVGNAQHLATILTEQKMTDRIPARYHGLTTEAGWDAFVQDLQAYLRNHSNGFGGGGTRLEKPPGWSGPWQPETPGYVPAPLTRPETAFISTVMAVANPDKGAQPGQHAAKPAKAGDYPAVAATRVAEKSGLTVKPRNLVKAPGGDMGAYGEPNELRLALEAKGVDVRKILPEAQSELSLEHMKNAKVGHVVGRQNVMFSRAAHSVAPEKMRGLKVEKASTKHLETAGKIVSAAPKASALDIAEKTR
jgi:hypothetical protein